MKLSSPEERIDHTFFSKCNDYKHTYFTHKDTIYDSEEGNPSIYAGKYLFMMSGELIYL